MSSQDVGIVAIVCLILAACEEGGGKDDEHAKERAKVGSAALADAGLDAKLLAVCGPFQAEIGADAPPAAKYIAFVEPTHGPLMVRAPFVLDSNPPVEPDPGIGATDAQGRALPVQAAFNTILKERSISPGRSSFTALVWRMDAKGAQDGDDREMFAVEKSPTDHKVRATVSVQGKVTTYTARCS